MENEEKDNRATGEELPPELIDPITLTLMEDPVMLIQCGHSFSAESIGAWTRLQAQAKTQCPVCKIGISPDQPPMPNWTLRNIIHRYREKHGKQLLAGGDSAAQVQIDLKPAEDDPLLKPSDRLPLLPRGLLAGGVEHTPRLASKPCSSSKKKKKPNSKKSEGTPPALTLGSSRTAPLIDLAKAGRTQAQSFSLSSPSAAQPAAGGQGQAQAGGGNNGSCECCCAGCELPKGPRGCCVWECDECGVCRMANDFKGDDCWFRFPVTTLTCQVSFSKWSNWCTRTLCGLIYPLWVPLVLCLMVCDQLLMLVFWSLWVLGSCFFKLTWYFCPSFNQWVDAKLGPASTRIGQIW